MYKVFFNKKEINLIKRKQVFYVNEKTQFIDFDEVNDFETKIKIFLRSRNYHKLIIVSNDLNCLRKSFTSIFTPVIAAGGIVFNDEAEILMIKKKGYWDFPKGKKDKGENLRKTAIREIKEETGIYAIIVKDKPYKTYHIYKYKNELALKTTYWYKMKQGKYSKPKPEAREGIEKAKWVNKTKAINKIDKSFPSLQNLLLNMLK